jgi:BlaI family transcriptional regulator, penicillinase repressor
VPGGRSLRQARCNLAEVTMRSKNSQTPKPTEAELGILNVLWDRGEMTVRELHEAHYRDDGTGYTTSLKMLQIMHAKGLVERNDSQRAHVYRAAVSKEITQKRFLTDIVQRVFDGSPSQLVLQALGGQPKASREELDEIRALLDSLEPGKKT